MTGIEARLQRAGRELRELDPEPPPLETCGRGGGLAVKLAPMALAVIVPLFGFTILGRDELPDRWAMSTSTSTSTSVIEAAAPVTVPPAEIDDVVEIGSSRFAGIDAPSARDEVLIIRSLARRRGADRNEEPVTDVVDPNPRITTIF